MNKQRTATHLSWLESAAGLTLAAAICASAVAQRVMIPMLRATPVAAPKEEPDEAEPPAPDAAPGAAEEEGEAKPGAKGPAPITPSKEETAQLKAMYESLPPEQQAEMKAYYADIGINLEVAFGLAGAKSAAAGRMQELMGAMREMDFSRRPQAVLAARAKLGFGQVPQPSDGGRAMDMAKWIHLQVMAGEWKVLGEWFKGRPEADAMSMYSQILQSMNRGDPGLLPEEVLALAEACPGELKPWQLTSLSGILKLAADKNSVGPMLTQIRAGTRTFGSQDAEHRRRTVEFLSGAGLVLDAYDFLSPLDEARVAQDAAIVLVHAKYKEGLAAKGVQGPESDGLRLSAWELYAEVSLMSKATFEARREAIGRGIALMNDVPRAQVSGWLDKLFSSETLGPTALELMALKAATIGDEKLSDEQRAKAILVMKEGIDVLLSHVSASESSLRVPMRMLTSALLGEIEKTVKDKGKQRMMTKEAQLLLRAIPSKQWFEALEPSLSVRASKACIAIATVADETDMAMSLLRDGISRTPDQAVPLAEHFLTFWEMRLNPQADQGEDEDRMMYYFYREYIPAAPLTRGRQRRNLDRLHQVMDTLSTIGIEPRTLPSIASAFKACHSRTEVFEREEIVRVFGPFDKIPAVTASALAQTMGASLNGDWRNRAAQQAVGVKRSDSEIAALVDKGYGVALDLVESALARQADSWKNSALKAGLSYDRMMFKDAQQKQDPAKLNEYRKASFEAFEQAAAGYAKALANGTERENATVFIRWFGAALGTPELNFLRKEELPTEGSIQDDQIERIRKAMLALPPDAAFRHISDFARAIGDAIMRTDPEVKPRLVHHALRIIGDHPAGASLRAIEELYRDLVKDEIKLRLTLDGEDRVGVAKPFGMLVSLRFTNAVDRETGGFAKYLQNNVWGRVGRQFKEINYRDEFQKEIEKSLGKTFSIETVGFFDPFMPPHGVTEAGQDGWLEKPMAYVMLTRKDPSVDRVPQLSMDMQFEDQTGPVTLVLPSNTPPLAVGDVRAARPCSDVLISQIVDVRDAQNGDKGGTIKLEVQIRGKGIAPDLREALDGIDDAIAGYTLAADGIETKPPVIIPDAQEPPKSRWSFGPTQPPKNGYPEPDATGMYHMNVERSWVLTYKPTRSSLGSEFKVPTLKSGVAATLDSKWYTDMDLAPVAGASIPVKPRFSVGVMIGLGAGVVAVAVAGVFAWRRRSKSQPLAAKGPHMPERVTPMSVVMTLRRIHQQGDSLDPARRATLAREISEIEAKYFGPGREESPNGDLSSALERWATVTK